MISIVVLTYSRVHLLEQCVTNVLSRTSDATGEIVIWDNASTDGTAAYLGGLRDPRIRVVRHERNIGQSAYASAFAATRGDYLIELDDDIVDAPPCWDRTLLDAFQRLPEIGFLAANLVDNEHDEAAYVMHHLRPDAYRHVDMSGVGLLEGPTGGGCAITSRELYDRVGGFRRNERFVFWSEDDAYVRDLARLGFKAAILEDLRVLHAGGAYYSPIVPEKAQWWAMERRRRRRKDAIKKALLCIPFVRPLNDHYRWFSAP